MTEVKRNLRETRKALAQTIKEVTGKEAIHPISGATGLTALWYLDTQLDLSRRRHARAADEFGHQPSHPGSVPALYTQEQICGVLDELKKASQANNKMGENLRRVPVTPEIIDATEQILFSIRQTENS